MLVKLEAFHDGEFWQARGIGARVFTQGETFEDLLENVKEALALHFEEELKQGETLQILVLTETEMKGELALRKPKNSVSVLSEEETQRRKALVERILKRRDKLPPLGMTTAELVRLARQGLESYDAS